MLEAGVAASIQDAGEAGREESPLQVLRAVADALEEAQDLRGAAAGVLAVLVRPVFLGVVLPDPPVVGGNQILPDLGFPEVVVRHPALDVERRLDKILPRLALLDRLLADAEGAVDGLGLVGLEDAGAVADQHLWGTVALHRRVKNGEVGGEMDM